jgi:hypothetical protein
MKHHFFASALVVAGLIGAIGCSSNSSPTSSAVTAPTSGSAAGPLSGGGDVGSTVLGNGAPSNAKLVFNWNLIGTPKTYQGGCGDGHRIFVQRDDKSAHILIQNSTVGWSIVDCNATGGNLATMDSNNLGTFDVYARILGKPGGNLSVCANVVTDPTNPLCLLGTINLTRAGGQSKFQVQPDSLFDASLQNVLWTVDTNPDFRIVQFRVYQTGQ